MFEHTEDVLRRAEELAVSTDSLSSVLSVLRHGLAMEEFGELMIAMPNRDFPGLSRVLPAMAPEHIQKTWTGSSGLTLHEQTAAFVRQFEVAYVRATSKPLHGKRILDFGCGYGRILRLLYFFNDPENLWGVDAWEKSLATCEEAGLRANLRLSDRVPEQLPTEGVIFDAALAFSVFTHLAPVAAKACLQAVRRSMTDGGILVATCRPVEFWPFIDRARGTDRAGALQRSHDANGFAYWPHNGAEGETYGDASYSMGWWQEQAGWRLLGHDWSRADPYQVSMVLQAV